MCYHLLYIREKTTLEELDIPQLLIEFCELNEFFIILTLTNKLVFNHNLDDLSSRKSKRFIYNYINDYCIRRVKGELSLITGNGDYAMTCLYKNKTMKGDYKQRKALLEELLKALNTDNKVNKKLAQYYLAQVKKYHLVKELS